MQRFNLHYCHCRRFLLLLFHCHWQRLCCGAACCGCCCCCCWCSAAALLLLFCFSHSIIVAVFFINAISGNICAAPRLTLFQATEREAEREREDDTHTYTRTTVTHVSPSQLLVNSFSHYAHSTHATLRSPSTPISSSLSLPLALFASWCRCNYQLQPQLRR